MRTSTARILAFTMHHVGVFRTNRPGFLRGLSLGGCGLLPGATKTDATRRTIQVTELSGTSKLYSVVGIRIVKYDGALLPSPVRAVGTTRVLLSRNFVILPCASSSIILTQGLRRLNYRTIVPYTSPVNSKRKVVGPVGLRFVARRTAIPVVISTKVKDPTSTTLTVKLKTSKILLGATISSTSSPIGVTGTVGLTVRTKELNCRTNQVPRGHCTSTDDPTRKVVFD